MSISDMSRASMLAAGMSDHQKLARPNRLYYFMTDTVPILQTVTRFQRSAVAGVASLALCGWLLVALQLLGLVVNPRVPWGEPVATGLGNVLYFTNMVFWDGHLLHGTGAPVLHAMLWVSLGTLLIAVVGAATHARIARAAASAERGSASSDSGSTTDAAALSDSADAVSQVLAVVFRSAASWALIPLLHVCFAGLVCHDGTVAATTGYTALGGPVACWSGEHTAWFIGALVLLVVVLATAWLLTSCDCDHSLLSMHPTARAHSFLDQLNFAYIVLTVAAFHGSVAAGVPALHCAILAAASLGMMGATCFFLPYYSHTANRVWAAVYGSITFAAVVGFFVSVFDEEESSLVGSTVLLAGLPLAAAAGWLLADTRLSREWSVRLRQCEEGLVPTEADGADHMAIRGLPHVPRNDRLVASARTRSFSLDRVQMYNPDEDGDINAFFEDSDGETSSSATSTGHTSDTSENNGKGGKGQETGRRHEIAQLISRTQAAIKATVAAPYISNVYVSTDVELAARFAGDYRRRMLSTPPGSLIIPATGVYSRGVARFPRSVTLLAQLGQYVVLFDAAKSDVTMALTDAIPQLNPSIAVMHRYSTLRSQLKACLGIHDAYYERYLGRASALHTDALQKLNQLWVKLMEPSVDVALAGEVADEFVEVRTRALRQYRAALQCQAHRSYVDADFALRVAGFFQEVMLDNEATNECQTIAGELVKITKSTKNRSRILIDSEMSTRASRLANILGAEATQTAVERGAGARRTQLLPQITFFFGVIVCCVAAVLAVALHTHDTEVAMAGRIVDADRLRTIPAYFLGTFYAFVAAPTDALAATLGTLALDFRQALARVIEAGSTTSAYRVNTARDAYVAPTVLTRTSEGITAASYWAVAGTFVSTLETLAAAANASLPLATNVASTTSIQEALASLQRNVNGLTTEAFSRVVRVWLDERAVFGNIATVGFVLAVAAALATTAVGVYFFVASFRSVARTKYLTLQLFTLIPFDSLERLSTDARATIDARERAAAATKQGAAAAAAAAAAAGATQTGLDQPHLLVPGAGVLPAIGITSGDSEPASSQPGEATTPAAAGGRDASRTSSLSTGGSDSRRPSAAQRAGSNSNPPSMRPNESNRPAAKSFWREHLAAAGGETRSAMKRFAPPPPLTASVAPTTRKRRVGLTNIVRVIEFDAGGDVDQNHALHGRAATALVGDSFRATASSDTGASRQLSAHESDVEALAEDEKWRAAQKLYPTTIIGEDSEQSVATSADVSGVSKRMAEMAEMLLRRRTGVAVLMAAVLALTCTAAITATVAAVDPLVVDLRHTRVMRAARAMRYSAAQLTARGRDAAAVLADPAAPGSIDRFRAYSATCGTPFTMEPLFNASYTSEHVALLREVLIADEKLVRCQNAAVLAAAFSGQLLRPADNAQLVTVADVAAALQPYASNPANNNDTTVDAAYRAAAAANTRSSIPVAAAPLFAAAGRRVLLLPTCRDLEHETIDRLVALQRSLSSDVAVVAAEPSAHRHLFTVAAACSFVALVGLCFVARGEAHTHSLTRGRGVASACGAALLLAAAVACLGAQTTLNHRLMSQDRATRTAADAVEQQLAVLQRDASLRGFVLGVRRGHLYSYAALDGGTALTGALLRVVNDEDDHWSLAERRAAAEAVTAATTLQHATARLARVGASMTLIAHQRAFPEFAVNFSVGSAVVSAASNQSVLEAHPATTAWLGGVSWDADTLPSTPHDLRAFYNGNASATFTTRANDVMRHTPLGLWRLGQTVVFDRRAAYWGSAAQSATTSAFDHLNAIADDHRRAVLRTAIGWAAASLALADAAAIVMILLLLPSIVRVAVSREGAVLESTDLSISAAEAQAMERLLDSQLFRTSLNRIVACITTIAVLLLALLGVGVYSARVSDRVMGLFEDAGSRGFIVAQSYVHLQQAVGRGVASGDVDSVACALRATRSLPEATQQLWLGSYDAGRTAALGFSPGFDSVNFGAHDPAPFKAYTAAFTASECSDLATPAAAAQPAAGADLVAGYTADTGLAAWQWFADVFAAKPAERTAVLATLAPIFDALMPLLDRATQELANTAISRVSSATTAVVALAAVTIAVIVGLYVFVLVPLSLRLREEQLETVRLLHVIPPEVRDLVPAITEFVETGTIDTSAEIRRKFELNERLLRNILPDKISRRLNLGELPIADPHPNITILFTDFVGFTSISSGLSAEEIVDFLNEVFVEFDLLVELLGLDKIKTIGDAYFMTGGLNPAITDHAMRVVEASIGMFEALDEHNARHNDRKPLRMRLGVHTGPAVAGVIGTKKVAYDLWGESVAIANAMESSGVPGKIHISATTLDQVRGYYHVVPRGELPEEKGMPDNMPQTYLVESRLLPTPYMHVRRPRTESAGEERNAAQRVVEENLEASGSSLPGGDTSM